MKRGHLTQRLVVLLTAVLLTVLIPRTGVAQSGAAQRTQANLSAPQKTRAADEVKALL